MLEFSNFDNTQAAIETNQLVRKYILVLTESGHLFRHCMGIIITYVLYIDVLKLLGRKKSWSCANMP